MGELTHIDGKNIFIFGPSVQASVMLQYIKWDVLCA